MNTLTLQRTSSYTLPKVQWVLRSGNGLYLTHRGSAWWPTITEAARYETLSKAVAVQQRMSATLLRLNGRDPGITVVPFEDFSAY